MAKKKKVKTYKVKWSMGCCPLRYDVSSQCHGTVRVDAQDVSGLSDEDRQEYFQSQVDYEVSINGPCGHVDSVDEIDE